MIDPARITPRTGASSNAERQRLEQAAQEFEAIFLQQLFSQMRSAARALSAEPPSYARQVYEGWQDQAMAQNMARAGGIGLHELLLRQLEPSRAKRP